MKSQILLPAFLIKIRAFMTKYFSVVLFLSFYSFTNLSAQVIDDFILEDLNNESVSLEEIKGDQLTAIDFWATWCKPCTKAMPKLNDIYHDYKDRGLAVIGISCDGPRSISKVPAVVNNLGIDYHILQDINCEVMNNYQYQAFPTFILLDEDNEVIYVHEGFNSGDESKLRKIVEENLQ